MYSVFRHLRRIFPLINIAFIDIKFGGYLIIIEMSLQFSLHKVP